MIYLLILLWAVAFSGISLGVLSIVRDTSQHLYPWPLHHRMLLLLAWPMLALVVLVLYAVETQELGAALKGTIEEMGDALATVFTGKGLL